MKTLWPRIREATLRFFFTRKINIFVFQKHYSQLILLMPEWIDINRIKINHLPLDFLKSCEKDKTLLYWTQTLIYWRPLLRRYWAAAAYSCTEDTWAVLSQVLSEQEDTTHNTFLALFTSAIKWQSIFHFMYFSNRALNEMNMQISVLLWGNSQCLNYISVLKIKKGKKKKGDT